MVTVAIYVIVRRRRRLFSFSSETHTHIRSHHLLSSLDTCVALFLFAIRCVTIPEKRTEVVCVCVCSVVVTRLRHRGRFVSGKTPFVRICSVYRTCKWNGYTYLMLATATVFIIVCVYQIVGRLICEYKRRKSVLATTPNTHTQIQN